MNIAVYCPCVPLSPCECERWAPLLHFHSYQTNEHWILIRQIVNSSSNVLSNSTCVFVTWSCYACILYITFVWLLLLLLLPLYWVWYSICSQMHCATLHCSLPARANNSMTLQSHAFPIQYILLFSSQLVRSHAMSAYTHTLVYLLCKSRYGAVNDILMHFLIAVLWHIYGIGSIGTVSTGMQKHRFPDTSSFSLISLDLILCETKKANMDRQSFRKDSP